MPLNISSPPFDIGNNSITAAKLQVTNLTQTYNATTIKSSDMVAAAGTGTKLYTGFATRVGIRYTLAANAELFGTFGFRLSKNNNPPASALNFTIRRQSDDALLYTKQLVADMTTITTNTIYSVQITESPVTLPAGVYYFSIEGAGTDTSNCIGIYNDGGATSDAEVITWLYNAGWATTTTRSGSFFLYKGAKWTFA